MIRNTSDPLVVQLLQLGLDTQGLYEGKIDGIYGPVTEAAYQVFLNFSRYAEIAALTLTLSADQKSDLAKFEAHWEQFEETYLDVGGLANVPAELVAAIHWREGSGSFSTYLHNGDPLGVKTVHDPKGIYFSSWQPAAVDALKRETGAYAASGIEEWTANLECMCVFAEHYNGEGYAERDEPDPYVLAGTSGYHAGKFVADDVYDPRAIDGQLGVLAMLKAIVVPRKTT